jgi:HTH-type transcriptional regulator / antitoxin HipB
MLKEERKKTKITQTELAERADMKKEVISRIENGKIDVQLSTFLRVLEGFRLRAKIGFYKITKWAVNLKLTAHFFYKL